MSATLNTCGARSTRDLSPLCGVMVIEHIRGDQKTSADTSESDHSDSEKSAEKPKRKKPRKASAVDNKRDRVKGIKAELHEKHGSSYTPIQYTLWAEIIHVGTHKGTEEPPSAPMFMGQAAKAKNTSDYSLKWLNLLFQH